MRKNISTPEFNITCMMCGNDCDIYEELAVAKFEDEYELWCYCKKCDIETFHEIPKDQ